MHIYTKLIIFLFFLFIKLLFFRASNNFEETERIIGNCRPKNNENINLINPSPMLIYLYQPTDPSMNSTGIWLKKILILILKIIVLLLYMSFP